MADARESFDNPITKHALKLPNDMLASWEPWIARDTDAVVKADSVFDSPSTRRILEVNEDGDLLKDAFDSEVAYEDRYLQIAEAVARCNRLTGRRRVASSKVPH